MFATPKQEEPMLSRLELNSLQFTADRLAALKAADASLDKPDITIDDIASAVKVLLKVASIELQDAIDSADAEEEAYRS